MKVERLLNILMYLINHDKVSANALAEHFDVSKRTIQRDIDHLTLAGIPIYSEIGRSGGYQLMDHFKLDKSYLNASESNLLYTFLSDIERTTPSDEIQTTCNKLMALFPQDADNDRLIIQMMPQFNQENFSAVFKQLTKSRDEHLKVTALYIDAELNETKRIIHPYRLVLMGNTWYVYGFCELRDAFRLFKISRMIRCDCSETMFTVKDMPDNLPWHNQMNSDRKSEKIVLELDRCLLGRLSDYFDYHNCNVQEDKIIATLDFPIDEWLLTLLCQLIPYVKIIEPLSLKKRFNDRLQKALQNNI